MKGNVWRWMVLVPGAILAIGHGGWSVLPAPGGEPAHWRLIAPSLDERQGDFAGSAVTIRLVETRASNAIDRRDMAYSRTSQSLAYYRDNRWIASPAIMFDEIIDESLSARPWVRNVVQGGARVPTDLALYCEIQQLEHQVEQVDGRVRLKVACSWYQSEGRKLIDTLRFDQAVEIERNDASHYAAGAQQLVGDFMQALTDQGRTLAASAGELEAE